MKQKQVVSQDLPINATVTSPVGVVNDTTNLGNILPKLPGLSADLESLSLAILLILTGLAYLSWRINFSQKQHTGSNKPWFRFPWRRHNRHPNYQELRNMEDGDWFAERRRGSTGISMRVSPPPSQREHVRRENGFSLSLGPGITTFSNETSPTLRARMAQPSRTLFPPHADRPAEPVPHVWWLEIIERTVERAVNATYHIAAPQHEELLLTN